MTTVERRSVPENPHYVAVRKSELDALEAENAALREQITALRYSLTKVRGHTCYAPECDRELLIGLLKSIERIADESLAKERR